MRSTRDNTLLSLWEYACEMSLDVRGMFGVSTQPCLGDSVKRGCDVSWVEYPWQHRDIPDRRTLKKRIAECEIILREFLGSPVGPSPIVGEQHTLPKWTDFIRTKYSKVITTGTETFTLQLDGLPQVRTFEDSGNWGFNDCVVYTIGDAGTPIPQPPDPTFDLCDLFVYPINWELEHGHRLRPFEASISNDGFSLIIKIPVYVSIDPEAYNVFGTSDNIDIIQDIDVCDPDNIISEVRVYRRSYELPAGVVRLDKKFCGCPTGDCEACNLPELPICLIPQNPELGTFRVAPLVNTEEDPLLPPCWEVGRFDDCCFFHPVLNRFLDYRVACDRPFSIKINYQAGWGSCWGDTCVPDEVARELRAAVAFLATSKISTMCDCGCLTDILSYYTTNLTLIDRSQRYQNQKTPMVLGNTQGAVAAWEAIRFLKDQRVEFAII